MSSTFQRAWRGTNPFRIRRGVRCPSSGAPLGYRSRPKRREIAGPTTRRAFGRGEAPDAITREIGVPPGRRPLPRLVGERWV